LRRSAAETEDLDAVLAERLGHFHAKLRRPAAAVHDTVAPEAKSATYSTELEKVYNLAPWLSAPHFGP